MNSCLTGSVTGGPVQNTYLMMMGEKLVATVNGSNTLGLPGPGQKPAKLGTQLVAAMRPVGGRERQPAHGQVGRAAGGHHVRAQVTLDLVGRGMRAGIHMADAAPRGQADVPDPAVVLRGGDGLRRDGRVGLRPGLRVRHLHGQRRIVEQHLLL